MDYAQRRRVKLWGRARVVEGDAALLARLWPEGYEARPEQVILFEVEAWDTNCPQHIPQMFHAEDVGAHHHSSSRPASASWRRRLPRSNSLAARRDDGASARYGCTPGIEEEEELPENKIDKVQHLDPSNYPSESDDAQERGDE